MNNKKPEIGLVTSVNINQQEREVRLNVLIGQRSESRDILAISPSRHAMFVPEEGDYVVVSFIEGKYVATSIDDTPEHEIPELAEGDICFTLNEGTALHFSKQGDGTYNIHIKTDGKLTVQSEDAHIQADGRLTMQSEEGFDLVDKNGYGIVSDNSGNFTWHHNDVDFDNTSTATVEELE